MFDRPDQMKGRLVLVVVRGRMGLAMSSRCVRHISGRIWTSKQSRTLDIRFMTVATAKSRFLHYAIFKAIIVVGGYADRIKLYGLLY